MRGIVRNNCVCVGWFSIYIEEKFSVGMGDRYIKEVEGFIHFHFHGELDRGAKAIYRVELSSAASPQANNVIDIAVPELNVMDHGVKVKDTGF